MQRDFLGSEPLITDVLCARSADKTLQEHPGNLTYNKIMREYRPLYQAKGANKKLVTQQVLDKCEETNIRFVQENEQGCWYLLSEDIVWEKLQKALRKKPKPAHKKKVTAGTEGNVPVAQESAPQNGAEADKDFIQLSQMKDLAQNDPSIAHVLQDKELAKDITEPDRLDVVGGRGSGATNHYGNKLLRRLVAINQDVYAELSKSEKGGLASSIVTALALMNGRFLAKNESDLWDEIPFDKATQKISQMFRDATKSGQMSGSPPTVFCFPEHLLNVEHDWVTATSFPPCRLSHQATGMDQKESLQGDTTISPAPTVLLNHSLVACTVPQEQRDLSMGELSTLTSEMLSISETFSPQMLLTMARQKKDTSIDTSMGVESISSSFFDSESDVSQVLASLGGTFPKQQIAGQQDSIDDLMSTGTFKLFSFGKKGSNSWQLTSPTLSSTGQHPRIDASSLMLPRCFDVSFSNGGNVKTQDKLKKLHQMGMSGGPDANYATRAFDPMDSDDENDDDHVAV